MVIINKVDTIACQRLGRLAVIGLEGNLLFFILCILGRIEKVFMIHSNASSDLSDIGINFPFLKDPQLVDEVLCRVEYEVLLFCIQELFYFVKVS